jgi:hypothetical protein
VKSSLLVRAVLAWLVLAVVMLPASALIAPWFWGPAVAA